MTLFGVFMTTWVKTGATHSVYLEDGPCGEEEPDQAVGAHAGQDRAQRHGDQGH